MKNISAIESVDALCALRRKIPGIEPKAAVGVVSPLGQEQLDQIIGGGLEHARLHEIFAEEAGDRSSAAGFVAGLASIVGQSGGPVFWLREEAAEKRGRLHAPGLAEMGLNPAGVVLAVLPDPVTLLRAAVDVVRCRAVGATIIELWRCPRVLDLTASRRLALAAEASGVTILFLRIAAEPAPSAAQTRWSVHAAPSAILEGGAPGRPAFIVELLRQRGRPDGGAWYLEWDRDRNRFSGSTLSGAVVSSPPGQSLENAEQRRVG